ncbi:MAG: L,D-transpeptidase/peptidoglycan binding protein [Acetatifactor sp.]|nr:L,D-transpeptidase/peptidoglycan binding protein [Acetatifactor sp.]
MENKEKIEQGENAKDSQAGNTSSEGKQKNKKKKFFTIFCVVVIFTILATYGGITYYYNTHFISGTVINEIDCSNLEAREAMMLIDARGYSYELTVAGRNASGESIELGVLNSSDVDLKLSDVSDELTGLMRQQNQFLWFEALFGVNNIYHLEQSVSFDEAALKYSLNEWAALQEENMEAPEDAYISEYSKSGNGYAIIPHTLGTQLDKKVVLNLIEEAILSGQSSLDLVEKGCYEEAKVKEDDAKLQSALEKMNQWVSASVKYDWHGTEVDVDGNQISQWITIENNAPVLDEEAVADFIAATSTELDTYGRKRKFHTTGGAEITIVNSRYGWKVSRADETEELLKLIYAGKTEEREPIYAVTAVCKGSDDIGSSYVEVDLSNQHLFLYENGGLALETDFVSGNMSNGCGTPGGIFGVTYKTKNAVLRGDNYETPVSYWMPFNGNIGMHDATWRRQFGGEIYQTSGSHGCINLPLGKAKEIYDYVSTGFPVICYY